MAASSTFLSFILPRLCATSASKRVARRPERSPQPHGRYVISYADGKTMYIVLQVARHRAERSHEPSDYPAVSHVCGIS